MLQIRNVDDSKSEWNVSEAHIIIPMIDGDVVSSKESDKILASTFTLNPLEGGDQAVLSNALEHNLVLGLDKNLFDSTNYKSDLLIIQNSDLKLMPCNNDMKLAYAFSNVDQDKGEILWQNPLLKDRICTNEKAVFEVRHVLSYDDVDLEKTSAQISLENVSNEITSQVLKNDKEVLIEEATNPGKNDTDSEFIAKYDLEADSSKSVCILLSTDVAKSVEKVNSVEKKKPLEGEPELGMSVIGSSYKLGEDFEDGVFNVTNHMVSYGDSSPVAAVDFGNDETDKKENLVTTENSVSEESKVKGETRGKRMSNSFSEKNLPLKKKAKMKRTITTGNWESHKSLLKQNMVAMGKQVKTVSLRKKAKPSTVKVEEEQDPNGNEMESSANELKPKRKVKVKSLTENSQVKEVKEDVEKADSFKRDETAVTKFKSIEFDDTNFSSVYDLVECLRKCKIINASVWQTLNSGLKEIKVDILKEMNAKRKESCARENLSYSPQLKAFALVLYFKQRAAFNHLSQVYGNGWPSLNVIKQWKRRMNSLNRRNLPRVESQSGRESKKS